MPSEGAGDRSRPAGEHLVPWPAAKAVRSSGSIVTAVLAVRRELLGEDHPHVALTKKDLAALLLEGEKPASAERLVEANVLLTAVLGILRAVKPEDSWEVAHAESLQGVSLMAQGRYQEAEPYLINGYLSLRELRGERG